MLYLHYHSMFILEENFINMNKAEAEKIKINLGIKKYGYNIV